MKPSPAAGLSPWRDGPCHAFSESQRLVAAALVMAWLAVPTRVLAQSCTQTLSPGANVQSAVSSAAAGSTICLESGNYNGFSLNGVAKSPRVTLRATSQLGASFTGGLTFAGNTNGLTFEGINFVGIVITGTNTRDLTFRNFNLTGQVRIDGVTTATPNILLEDFSQIDLDVADANPAGIYFPFAGRGSPVATIRRAIIDGGCADGIQSGVPFILEQSRIMNKQVGSCPNDPHTDAVQLYGGPFAGTIIKNNYFYRNVQVLTAYDGVDNVLIENNIFDPGPDGERRPCQIEWYSDVSSIIRHNTVLYRGADYGSICLDRKPADSAGYGTVVVDNIANDISVYNDSTWGERHHNLLRTGAGTSEIAGAPTYKGGPTPTTVAAFELAPSSLGKGAASSPAGSDVGAIVWSASPAAPAAPTGLIVSP